MGVLKPVKQGGKCIASGERGTLMLVLQFEAAGVHTVQQIGIWIKLPALLILSWCLDRWYLVCTLLGE